MHYYGDFLQAIGIPSDNHHYSANWPSTVTVFGQELDGIPINQRKGFQVEPTFLTKKTLDSFGLCSLEKLKDEGLKWIFFPPFNSCILFLQQLAIRERNPGRACRVPLLEKDGWEGKDHWGGEGVEFDDALHWFNFLMWWARCMHDTI